MRIDEPQREEGIAHLCGSIQTVYQHLDGTSNFASEFGLQIGMPRTCELLGLLHDIGKLSDAFYEKITNNGTETVDHSTCGAQFVEAHANNAEKWWAIIKQALALVSMSHHSGLIDVITPEGEDVYGARIDNKARSNYYEIIERVKPERKSRLIDILNSNEILLEFENVFQKFPEKSSFHFGLLLRYLLSCLVDADRLDTERFCSRSSYNKRYECEHADWNDLIEKLDTHLSSKRTSSVLDDVRDRISEMCMTNSSKVNGIYSLNLPTGSGKTLASLRFALNHARSNNMKRVIYVAPYISILDQNAKVVKDMLEEFGDTILEHHSNVVNIDEDDENSASKRIIADNWDSQLLFTTMVQFLNTLFASGTSVVRRMHNLSHSVIIFDEIQSLPVKCISLFNRAVNFITTVCGSTAVLCTATQPPLDDVRWPLRIGEALVDLSEDMKEVFRRTHVSVHNERDTNSETISELIRSKVREEKSVLFISNTKEGARAVFKQISNANADLYHLSTNMCPAHRKKVIESIRKSMDEGKSIVCVSTQLIEAGVDLDFNVVIRSMAGLDSIAQAAGRCNRNGKMSGPGEVIIVKLADEKIGALEDIRKGQRATERVLREHPEDPIGEEALKKYYEYYFNEVMSEMDYKTQQGAPLLFLLDKNEYSKEQYMRINNNRDIAYPLCQSFKTANKEFRVISDSDKISVISEYGEGPKIADEIEKLLRKDSNSNKMRNMLRKAQEYSVEVFKNKFDELKNSGDICELIEGCGVYRMRKGIYDEKIGLDIQDKV